MQRSKKIKPFHLWAQTWRVRTDFLSTGWRTAMVLMLFFLLTALAPIDRGVHYSVAWKSSQGRVAHGLLLYALTDQGSISYLLVEGPNSQMVTLTKIVDAGRGKRTIRLEDGLDGWWIEMVEDYGTSWPNLRAALSSISEEANEDGEESFFTLSLRTQDGLSLEVELPRRPEGYDLALLQSLNDQGQRSLLARAIPPPIRGVVEVLTEALAEEFEPSRRVGGESESLLKLCTWALEGNPTTGASDDETWMFAERGAYHRGITLAEPEFVELVSKFPSLENTDPMRGMRPADLFPPEGTTQ